MKKITSLNLTYYEALFLYDSISCYDMLASGDPQIAVYENGDVIELGEDFYLPLILKVGLVLDAFKPSVKDGNPLPGERAIEVTLFELLSLREFTKSSTQVGPEKVGIHLVHKYIPLIVELTSDEAEEEILGTAEVPDVFNFDSEGEDNDRYDGNSGSIQSSDADKDDSGYDATT